MPRNCLAALTLAAALACSADAPAPDRQSRKTAEAQGVPPEADSQSRKSGGANGGDQQPEGAGDFGVVYEAMMMELADNVVRRAEEASKHEYATLAEAKAALDEVLPQNSLGQLDAVLAEAGVDKRTMAEFMKANPEIVAAVGKKFEARLAEAEPAVQKIVAQVEALQGKP